MISTLLVLENNTKYNFLRDKNKKPFPKRKKETALHILQNIPPLAPKYLKKMKKKNCKRIDVIFLFKRGGRCNFTI